MAHSKILNHKHKKLIIKMLLEGQGVRRVEKEIKRMYPDDKTMHISLPTLQAFRKEHLNLEGKVLDDLKKTTKEKRLQKDLKGDHDQVKKFSTYKKKLEEIADTHIDIRKSLIQLDALIKERMEKIFDSAQAGTASIDEEKLLQGYFDKYSNVIDKWAKYVDKLADYRVEQNVNINIVNEQMSLLRTAVANVLQKLDPSLSIKFIEELNIEMQNLSYSNGTSASLNSIHQEVVMLKENNDDDDGI